MSEPIRTCIDRHIPEEDIIPAAERAIEENPLNAPEGEEGMGVNELALVTGKMWENGKVLKVAFLDGHPDVRAKVQPIADEWSQHANITFDFGNHAEPDIRISFEQAGSWSFLGTDALQIAADEATMNYGWLRPESADSDYHRVVRHEFGHALACIHEHQNPAGDIPWDMEKLYDFYGGPPNNWPKAQVFQNLIQKYSDTTTQFSEFDPDSIMLYPIPTEHTIGDFEVGLNSKLSATDKDMIGRMYPKDT